MSKLSQYQSDTNLTIVNGSCPHDCPDTCTWQVAVDKRNGRAVDIWGHADHPVTQGVLCGKVDRYLDRTYHKERLTTPLRRVGPKGSGQFEPLGWDEAITEIADRLKSVVDEFGAEAVLPYSYAGTMGQIQWHWWTPTLLQPAGRKPIGPHHLLATRYSWLLLHHWCHRKHGDRRVCRLEIDPTVGNQYADQQYASMALCTGCPQAGG